MRFGIKSKTMDTKAYEVTNFIILALFFPIGLILGFMIWFGDLCEVVADRLINFLHQLNYAILYALGVEGVFRKEDEDE